MTNFGISVKKVSEQCGDAGSRQTDHDRKTDQSQNDNYPASHYLPFVGLNAHASISTAPPAGNEATPMVLRAGRLMPKPST